MNINKMSDEQKSVMLARLCGIRFYYEPERVATKGHWCATNDDWMITSTYDLRDIYNPSNMALAWRVLNWALRAHINSKDFDKFFEFRRELRESLTRLWGANFAQRAWLDKILTLAIEAGMVTE